MMLDLKFICDVFQSELLVNNQLVHQVCTDSRLIQENDVFIALVGDQFDGHDFIEDVFNKGAILAIVSQEKFISNPRCIVVHDTLLALGKLAHAWREVINPCVLGITGSGGKTTVKEMIATVLRQVKGSARVLATEGNYNNHIGLPLTLLGLNEQHQYAVIEMGMNHFGELDYLTKISRPDVAIVNNILRAHIGCGFSGEEDIARAKKEIFHGLATDGIAILPQEDAQLEILKKGIKQKILSFGIHQGQIHAENIQLSSLESSFDVVYEQERVSIILPTPGLHNIHNALACCAVLLCCGVSLEQISQGLSIFKNTRSRLSIHQKSSEQIVIDDTYNANPDSMKVALDVLSELKAPQVFIMGDMGELGDNSPKMHAEIGEYALEKKIQYAFFVGENSYYAAQAFGSNARYFRHKQELLHFISNNDIQYGAILVKGSHFMHMEDIVNILIN